MIFNQFCPTCEYLESTDKVDIYKSCEKDPKKEGYIVKFGNGENDYAYYTLFHLNTKDPIKKIKEKHKK